MMTDPIADMLTRIRNASNVHKKEVAVPYSKLKMAIANILVKNGYLAKAEELKENHPQIVLTLKYYNGQSAINNIKRISKPGHRRYVKNEDIKTVISGFGLAILSTPKGLLTNTEARNMHLGGELICEVF